MHASCRMPKKIADHNNNRRLELNFTNHKNDVFGNYLLTESS